jgi:hypothetical protein
MRLVKQQENKSRTKITYIKIITNFIILYFLLLITTIVFIMVTANIYSEAGNRDACGPLKRTLDPGPSFRVGGVFLGGGWAGVRGGGPGNLQFPTIYPGSVGVRDWGSEDPSRD